MTTFLVAHGAWSAGWAWKKMRPLMRQRGHELVTPTYTGLGERSHLAHRDVDLETHITDVLNVLYFENLTDVVLVGHSYGGMVATAVADRAADRIAQVVYVDAFVPRDGQSLLALLPEEARVRMLEAVRLEGNGWRVPPNPMPSDSSEADVAWATPRRVMQPLKTFEQPVRLTGAIERLRRTYIYCTRPTPGDVLRQFAERARSETGWQYIEIDASHNPHITVPAALAKVLDDLSRDPAHDATSGASRTRVPGRL
jgi:pimeloyl-ACP methyl ester carboxylesterase